MDSIQLTTRHGNRVSLPLNFFLERYAEAYKTEMNDYILSLENNTDTPANGNDGLQSLKIGLAAIKSLKLNRPVRLSEIS
jgi:myo-inositol 2-dehydrogenase/D-chiro-inositol 1-dehydrogenase